MYSLLILTVLTITCVQLNEGGVFLPLCSEHIKVNIVFVLKEVRPEMELFLDNHLRCVKSLNVISKYIPNARLTIYLIFFLYL